jgi:hypothetical protein
MKRQQHPSPHFQTLSVIIDTYVEVKSHHSDEDPDARERYNNVSQAEG